MDEVRSQKSRVAGILKKDQNMQATIMIHNMELEERNHLKDSEGT
jgi:hypothetical protein